MDIYMSNEDDRLIVISWKWNQNIVKYAYFINRQRKRIMH